MHSGARALPVGRVHGGPAHQVERAPDPTMVGPQAGLSEQQPPEEVRHVVDVAVGEFAPNQLVDRHAAPRSPSRSTPRRRRGRLRRRPGRIRTAASSRRGWPAAAARCRNQARCSAGTSAGSRRGASRRVRPDRPLRRGVEPREQSHRRRRAPSSSAATATATDSSRAGRRPASDADATTRSSIDSLRAAALSSIMASGCPAVGVAGSSREPHPSAARQSASRTANPACSARRTRSDSRARSGTPRAASNVASVYAIGTTASTPGIRQSVPTMADTSAGRSRARRGRSWRSTPADLAPAEGDADDRALGHESGEGRHERQQVVRTGGTDDGGHADSVPPAASARPAAAADGGRHVDRRPCRGRVSDAANSSESSATSPVVGLPGAAGRGVLPDLLGARRARDHARERRLREQPAERGLEHRDAAPSAKRGSRSSTSHGAFSTMCRRWRMMRVSAGLLRRG